MDRVVVLAILLAASATSIGAEAQETLDEDFLAYLAELESDEDDWTIVETPAAVASAKKPAPERTTAPKTTPQPPPTTRADDRSKP